MRYKLYRNLAAQFRATAKRPAYVTWTSLYASGPKKGLAAKQGDGVVLKNVEFEVSEPMRQTVIRMAKKGRKKKTPHAFAVGEIVKIWPVGSLDRDLGPEDLVKGAAGWVRIGYDPYTTPTFIREDCLQPVLKASMAVATPTGVYAKLPPCKKGRTLRGLSEPVGAGAHFEVDPFDPTNWDG